MYVLVHTELHTQALRRPPCSLCSSLSLLNLFPSYLCIASIMRHRLFADRHGGEAEPDARDGAGRRLHDPRGPSRRGSRLRDHQRRSFVRPPGGVAAAVLRHHGVSFEMKIMKSKHGTSPALETGLPRGFMTVFHTVMYHVWFRPGRKTPTS